MPRRPHYRTPRGSCSGVADRTRERAQEETGNVFEFLRHLGARYKSVDIPGLPPFTAGAVGYLSYEAVRMLERLPPRVDADVDLDDAVFMYFSNVLAFDHVQHRLFLISNVLTEEGKGSLRTKYDDACRHLDHLESRLRRPLKLSRTRKPKGPLRVRTNMTRPHYEAMVVRSKEYIRAGDIFQVVLSQRMEVPVRVPAFDVYRALRAVNPSPYMYYLRLGESTVLGSSPEMLVKVAGRNVEYRPIAGTRPRGKTDEEDKRLEEELRSDAKECAEHIMLVDLGRNDVGRVSEFSSVRPQTSCLSSATRTSCTWSRRSRANCAPTPIVMPRSPPAFPPGRSPARPRSAPWRSSTNSNPPAAAFMAAPCYIQISPVISTPVSSSVRY